MSDTGTNWLDRPVGEVVAEDYARAAVFTRMGIDFCCGGGRTVRTAAERAGISEDEVVEALASVGSDGAADPREWSLERLAEHIETQHHDYLRRTLPVLAQWLEKLVRVHGAGHPALVEVRAMMTELSAELVDHMEDEEARLFPLMSALDTAGSEARTAFAFPDGVFSELEEEHEKAGELMRKIRNATDGFQPPAEACATWRATFALLREFETDLHRHVHLENNILFPRAVERVARP